MLTNNFTDMSEKKANEIIKIKKFLNTLKGVIRFFLLMALEIKTVKPNRKLGNNYFRGNKFSNGMGSICLMTFTEQGIDMLSYLKVHKPLKYKT